MSAGVEPTNFAGELRKQTQAVRIHHEKMGTRKALSATQREAAAVVFHADRNAISAAKKLINTKHDAFRKVSGIRHLATYYWKTNSVPYPEKGIRLIRRDNVSMFVERMQSFQAELRLAVQELQEAFDELKTEARERLGDLFDPSDYPYDVASEFSLDWDFPNVDPPEKLKALFPAIYEQEQQRIQARFDEAVRMAEEAFAVELAEMVAHLCDRLSGGADGKPKLFKDSAVENLKGFFDRFATLNIRSNADLDKLVEQAKEAISSTTPDQLRKDVTLRQTVGEKLGQVREAMDNLMVNAPRRKFDFSDEETSEEAGEEPTTGDTGSTG